MNPRTSLAITAVLMVVMFFAARFYIGRALDRSAEVPGRPTPPVHVVDMAGPAPERPPAPPEAEPTPEELAMQQVEGALMAFTTLVELQDEARMESAESAVAGWEALDDATIDELKSTLSEFKSRFMERHNIEPVKI